MSTSCTIRVEGVPLVLVKHWDGHPDAVLPWLEKFHNGFTRINDDHGKFAQLVRSSSSMAEEFLLDPSEDTGWRVFPDSPDLYAEFGYVLPTVGKIIVSRG